MKRLNALFWVLVLAAAGYGQLTGCSSSVEGIVTTNSPPDARINSTSAPDLKQTEFTIRIWWSASDKDGWVDHYLWRISNNGPDGIIDPGDTAGLPWNSTFVTDSTFVVSADLDSFESDLEFSNDPANFRFWQTHTFFLKAIDNVNAESEAAAISFTATTIAPTININLPARGNTNTCVSSARALTFGWEGEDPDEVTGEPEAVRYALVDITALNTFIPPERFAEAMVSFPLQQGDCLLQSEYDRLNPVAYFPDDAWSDWIAYDAPEDSGLITTFPLKDIGESFLFALQARDVAGAVTPTFRWEINMRHVRVSAGKVPFLVVTEQFLGTKSFTGSSGLQNFDIVSGQPLNFTWQANAEQYAGIIEAYRYGWNIQDVNDEDDPGWAVSWGSGPTFLAAPENSFTQGNPNFVIQVRDNSGSVTRGTYQFEVIQIVPRASQRSLLVIDDWGYSDTPDQQALKFQWQSRWKNFFRGQVLGWSENEDFISADVDGNRVEFRTVNNYKGVVWFVNGASERTVFNSALRPQQANLKYHWLEVYQSKVGNILFVGPNAMVGSVEFKGDWLFPLVFDIPDVGGEGFGTRELPDGSEVNEGTFRWPYSGWCLEAVSYCRPVSGFVFGEPPQVREYACDYLAAASVAPAFVENFPQSIGFVDSLRLEDVDKNPRFPDPDRGTPEPEYKFQWEEFYNVNLSTRDVSLNLRSCQMPMYLWRGARDVQYPPGHPAYPDSLKDDPKDNCSPEQRPRSPLDGVPVAMVSTVYSNQKQLLGSEDFLWGFHPLAFNPSEIQRAMLWIVDQRWQIPVSAP